MSKHNVQYDINYMSKFVKWSVDRCLLLSVCMYKSRALF